MKRKKKSKKRAPNKYYTLIRHPKDFYFDCQSVKARLSEYNPLEDKNLKDYFKLKHV